jgi:hypothetical protein
MIVVCTLEVLTSDFRMIDNILTAMNWFRTLKQPGLHPFDHPGQSTLPIMAIIKDY